MHKVLKQFKWGDLSKNVAPEFAIHMKYFINFFDEKENKICIINFAF